MAASDEVLEVRRRARRRLVGATALVLLLVIVPPWLMDLEPRPVTSTLSVEIPGKDLPKLDVRSIDQKSTARAVVEPAPADEDRAAKANSVARPPDAVKLPPVHEARPKAKPGPPDTEKASLPIAARADDSQRAAAILKGESYVIPLGAFSNADSARLIQQKATGLGLKAFVEVVDVKGMQQSRVRAGPFGSREAADAARERLRTAGMDPGPVRAQ